VPSYDDDDEWVGGVPPEGHHTRAQARPEFWWHQRPPQIAFAGIVVVLAILAIVVLAGCGGSSDDDGGGDRSSQSAEQILKEVAAELGKVRSYHVSGTSVDKEGSSVISGDVTDSGAVRLSVTKDGEPLTVISVDGQQYLKASGNYWRDNGGAQGPRLAGLLGDRWVKMPASSVKSLQADINRTLPKELAYCLSQETGPFEKAGMRSVDGRPTIVIRNKDTKPGSEPGELYVPTSGPALPVRTRQTGPRRPGGELDPRCENTDSTEKSSTATFSKFNAVKPISAPPNPLDLEQLGRAGGGGTA